MNDNSMVMTMVTNTNSNSGRKRKRSIPELAKGLLQSYLRNGFGVSTEMRNFKTLKSCATFLVCRIREREEKGHNSNIINEFE